jgi:16S rRNA (guanine527-N7)-methyltransferase
VSQDQEKAAIIAVAARFGQTLAAAQAGAMLAFCRLLLAWNQKINLTGADHLDQLVEEHLPDAFALSALVPASASLVDVGTGGGLPALPFCVLRPDVTVTLVEPRAKRVAFLRTALRELGLAADVRTARVEALPAAAFLVACSRATFPPARWLQEGRRLVQPGGRVVVFLAGAGEELDGIAPSRRVEYTAGKAARTAAAFDVPRETPPAVDRAGPAS